MYRSNVFVLLASLLLLLLLQSAAALAVDACWENTEHAAECTISATLEYASGAQPQADLSMEIDCFKTPVDDAAEQQLAQSIQQSYQLLLRRFDNVEGVSFDGCRATLNTNSYGFELLPNCDALLRATVTRFHGDAVQVIGCGVQPAQLQLLNFNDNEIASVTAKAFEGLVQLREIHFRRNCLRHVQSALFERLPALKVISMEQETCLRINDANFLVRSQLAELSLIGLEYINVALLQQLPQTMQLIELRDTQLDGDSNVTLINPHVLRNASFVNCGLRAFVLQDAPGTVLHLNLSKNSLTSLEIHANSLMTLDLSENALTYVRNEWLRSLQNLAELLLHGNQLKQLTLRVLLKVAPSVRSLDIRSNALAALGEAENDALLSLDCEQLRVLVDDNPWSCKWLLSFKQRYPELFRIFQYKKFISKINVNGLECNPGTEATTVDEITTTTTTTTSAPALSMNMSTFTLVYGGSRDSKRNQRAEALILVFMLPLGIALLFVLLYMWIYCQKMFHLSYYRRLPCMGGSFAGGGGGTADRFDIVRPIETVINNATAVGNCGGYEVPLNVASACNCHKVANKTSDDIGCQKTHHITYEALPPTERPQKLYEEIMGYEQDEVHPFYDQLTYVDAARDQ